MPEEELPSIDELGEKIKKAKKASLEQDVKSSAPGAMHIGIDLVAGVVGGSLVGYYIDKLVGTKGVFFIICFFLVIAGSVLNILRAIKNADKSGEDVP
jgi:F0F1-type ATP synthase assembly protein I